MADNIAAAHSEVYAQPSTKGSAGKYKNQQDNSSPATDNNIFGETSDKLQATIALRALSLPAAYHTLRIFPGVFLTITLRLITIFTSYLVGQVKLAYPQVTHYANAGRLLFRKFSYELFSAAMVLELIMSVGSHALTGSIALGTLNRNHICSIVFSAISAVILFILAIPPSFTEITILSYIDFTLIITAIGIIVIAAGIKAQDSPGGLSGGKCNIIFAFSFAISQFSFIDKMHTPKDFIKSIWASGITQIIIYTLTGALCYAFIGPSIQSPALLSSSPLISKITFGIALPVIFISGSINSTVALRYIHGRLWKKSIIQYVNTPKGWLCWVSLAAVLTIIAWVITEAIPIFSDLLSLVLALFFRLLYKGNWFSRKNIIITLGSILAFIIRVVALIAGIYATIADIINLENI
ncbi:transmembrane amino acid transporter domain-containing protein [Trichoderma compactum]